MFQEVRNVIAYFSTSVVYIGVRQVNPHFGPTKSPVGLIFTGEGPIALYIPSFHKSHKFEILKHLLPFSKHKFTLLVNRNNFIRKWAQIS